jgi:AcrR family transcriptional regulator
MTRMPTTEGARRTRDRVLSAALQLFNERGTASVTTNHVAERAGISPGNLYYWFSDKNEIVRELYAEFVAAYEQLWRGSHSETRSHGEPGSLEVGVQAGVEAGVLGDPLDLTPEEVLARLAEGAALSRRYAFLARDLLGLLHGDPVLAAEYRAVRERRIAEFTDLAGAWRARGLIRPLDEGTVTDLVQALWVIAETWLAFGELDGSHPDAELGTRLLGVVLRPYLTPDGESVTTPHGESFTTPRGASAASS